MSLFRFSFSNLYRPARWMRRATANLLAQDWPILANRRAQLAKSNLVLKGMATTAKPKTQPYAVRPSGGLRGGCLTRLPHTIGQSQPAAVVWHGGLRGGAMSKQRRFR